MPKNKVTLVLIVILAAAVVFFMLTKIKPGILLMSTEAEKSPEQTKAALPKQLREKITYDVKLGSMQIGKSYFSYISQEEFFGKTLNLMLFETQLAKFSDTEKVYSDPKTLLPVKVERKIKKWFNQENIIEDYNQANFTVKISKTSGNKLDKQIIQKNSSINNAILLPHYLRRYPQLTIGTEINVNLPTRELTIKLIAIETITVPAGTFQTYHFQSTPKQIDVWITDDERHIPIKIESNGVLGYSLVMKTYSPK